MLIANTCLSLAPLGGQHKTVTEDYERLLTEDDQLPFSMSWQGSRSLRAHSPAVFTSRVPNARLPLAQKLWMSHDTHRPR